MGSDYLVEWDTDATDIPICKNKVHDISCILWYKHTPEQKATFTDPPSSDPESLPRQERITDRHILQPYETPPPPSFKSRRTKKPKTKGRRK